MRRLIVASILLGFATIGYVSSSHGAGSSASDETEIRKLIATGDSGGALPHLSDEIFWSGAYKRPFVLPEQGEPFDTPRSPQQRVAGSQRSVTQVIRIVFSDSHDLAYEYSKSTLSFDLKTGEHHSFDTGILRVWQKDSGQWKVAASFMRPYDSLLGNPAAPAK